MIHGTNSQGYYFFFPLSYFVCQAFLGDLIPKGEKFGSKQGEKVIDYLPKGEQKVKMIIFPKGSNFDSKREEKEEVAKMGRKQRGLMDLGGGQVKCLMMVSIQASVSGSICQFLQNLCLF